MTDEYGDSSPFLTTQAWFTDTCANRVSSIVLPWRSAGPALPGIEAGGGQSQLSHQLQVLMGRGWGRVSFFSSGWPEPLYVAQSDLKLLLPQTPTCWITVMSHHNQPVNLLFLNTPYKDF